MKRALSILVLAASATAAQQPAVQAAPVISLPHADVIVLARAQVAINTAHDSSNVQLAKPANKKADVQQELKEKFAKAVEEILHHHGLDGKEFRRRTFMVSMDTASRRVFDSAVVALTGAPLPGIASNIVRLTVPPGPAGTHIGHVVNGFADAPALMGLLPAAMAEARIAAQHATLASRQPTNLGYMKTHAGHVVHALDPAVFAAGPGLGYGVKKAAAGVAEHIELAARAEGATPAISVHATHIAMSARNTIARADQLIELAKKVLAANDAAAAAELINQIVSLADQLIEGADANSDGRITWEQGEGGLRHADEHAKLMLGVR